MPSSGDSRATRLDTLLADRAAVFRYKDLPRPHQLALAYFLALQRDAWANLLPEGTPGGKGPHLTAALATALPRYVSQYGDLPFGGGELPPLGDVAAAVMEDPGIKSAFPTWEAYHAWYCSLGGVPAYVGEEPWPVILSASEEETLLDGWHRLHAYAMAGRTTVPVVYFLRPYEKIALRRKEPA